MQKVALIKGITEKDGSYLAQFLLHKKYNIIANHFARGIK